MNSATKDKLMYAAFMYIKLADFAEEHEKYGNKPLMRVAVAASNMVKGYFNKLQAMATEDELESLSAKAKTQTMLICYNDQAGQITKDFERLFRISRDDLEVIVGHAVHNSCAHCHLSPQKARLCDLRLALNHIELEGHNEHASCPYMGMDAEKG